MNLGRLANVLRARWVVVATVAVLTAALGTAAATVYNNRIESAWLGTAPVTFISGDTESSEASANRLESARTTAESTLSSPDVRVEIAESAGQLRFVAEAPTQDAAVALAEDARTTFLTIDPSSTLTGQIETNLRRLEAEAATIRARLGEASPPVSDPASDQLRSLLTQQLASQIETAASLRFHLSFPEFAEAPPEELEADLAEAEALIDDLRAELESLPAPVTEVTETGDLDTLVLQRRLELVQNEYVQLSLRLLDLLEAEGFTEPAVATDITATPISPSQAGVAGGVVGALLAIAGLMVHDRTRRPLLAGDDVTSTVLLAEVHRSRVSPPDGVWYATAPASPRHRDVQTLRATLEPALRSDNSSLGLVGVHTEDAEMQALAADLAASVAATDRRVLLIDAHLSRPSRLPEFSATLPDLDRFLTIEQQPGEDVLAWMKESLAVRDEVYPGLISLRSLLPVTGAAADRLSSRQFRWLLEAATDQTDVIVVAGPDRSHPGADVIAQHVRHVVLVAERAKTSAAQLDRTVKEYTDRHIGVAGVVMLTGGIAPRIAGSIGGRHKRRSARRTRDQAPVGEDSSAQPVDDEDSDTRIEIDLQAPNDIRTRHRPMRVAAKTVFSLADLGSDPMPGPRILLYHQIGTHLGREMEIPTKVLVRQLEWIENEGPIVPLETAVSRVHDPDFDSLFVLTFDDGYLDLYTNAFPILYDGGIPFTLYLTTHPVESGKPLSPGADPLNWDQIGEMADSGLMTLGAHTHNHIDLRTLEPGEIAAELDTSNQLIREHLGIDARHFAYPWGYWAEPAEPLVRKKYATATLGAGEPITPETDAHRLHRIPIQRSDGMTFFRRKLTTGMLLEEKMRRRVRGYEGAPT